MNENKKRLIWMCMCILIYLVDVYILACVHVCHVHFYTLLNKNKINKKVWWIFFFFTMAWRDLPNNKCSFFFFLIKTIKTIKMKIKRFKI